MTARIARWIAEAVLGFAGRVIRWFMPRLPQ